MLTAPDDQIVIVYPYGAALAATPARRLRLKSDGSRSTRRVSPSPKWFPSAKR